jgi:hypothetical protein
LLRLCASKNKSMDTSDFDQIADEYDDLSEINSELPSVDDNVQEFVETE